MIFENNLQKGFSGKKERFVKMVVDGRILDPAGSRS